MIAACYWKVTGFFTSPLVDGHWVNGHWSTISKYPVSLFFCKEKYLNFAAQIKIIIHLL